MKKLACEMYTIGSTLLLKVGHSFILRFLETKKKMKT